MTLATSVRNVKYSFKATPRSIVFISGMPEPGNHFRQYQNESIPLKFYVLRSIEDLFGSPMDWGATNWTNPALNSVRQTGSEIQAAYCAAGLWVKSLYNHNLAEKRKKNENWFGKHLLNDSLA